MITRIEVNGFKSLTDFKLDVKPGLNILVGPNGAGKTNIVQFFEFLANLTDRHVGKAIIASGGVGSVFQKIGKDRFVEDIRCRVSGIIEMVIDNDIEYNYSFTIHKSSDSNIVFYSNQGLMIKVLSKRNDGRVVNGSNKQWDLEIEFKMKDELSHQVVDIKSLNSDKLRTLSTDERNRDYDLNEEQIRAYLLRNDSGYHSIINALSSYGKSIYFFSILYDLVSGKAFNIVPDRVRELEDSATPSGINKDGSGLAATLYSIQKKREKPDNKHHDYSTITEAISEYYGPEVLNRVVKYLRAANSTIESLDVENDPFSNKLIVKITIKSGEYSAVLPLSAMSDGTIKWLTLITAILTSKTMFSIEEPENYLHPWMQAEIVNIMREQLEEKSEASFILMTTHSETLINYAKPEEIILVSLSDGKTIAKRMPVSKQKLVKKEIANTGFGLGCFYFSNALSND